MNNPLTSKERRGLVAVAAAALLCIASGFIFRNCSHGANGQAENVTQIGAAVGDSIYEMSAKGATSLEKKDSLRKKSNKKRRSHKGVKSDKSAKKSKKNTVYPTRSPLDQPCD